MRTACLDYEKNENRFEKMEHVQSYLLYGKTSENITPLFTILIPTYKRVNLLEEAIESALRQWHVPFGWQILVLDNEPYDGKPNATEKLIRKIDNERIVYYRNSKNLLPGDNFNRGILLSKSKWVMMLHDDDILFAKALQVMFNYVTVLENLNKKAPGAISAKYHQFYYDIKHPDKHKTLLENLDVHYASLPIDWRLYRLSHSNVIFSGHVGGDVPSNGTTFNRDAVISVGGFNEDFGISADLVLYYCLENEYDVYSTMMPLGFYRWGKNTMSKIESVHKVVKFGFDFREYAYSKNMFTRLWGFFMRKVQNRRFIMNVLAYRKRSLSKTIPLKDFSYICNTNVNKHWYVFYALIVRYFYESYKAIEMKRLYKKILEELRNNNEKYI